MRFVLAFVICLFLASAANAQCSGGVCYGQGFANRPLAGAPVRVVQRVRHRTKVVFADRRPIRNAVGWVFRGRGKGRCH